MRFRRIVCSPEVREKLYAKHDLALSEVEEAALGTPRLEREGELYHLYGRTDSGRYLHVILRDIGDGTGRVVTAYSMKASERRLYNKK